MNPPNKPERPGTICVHGGTHRDERTGGVCSPIFTSTVYAHPHPTGQNIYPRYFNVANQRVVARKVALLEKAEEGLVFGSGMAAISTVLFAWVKPGDHVILQADLYGGTHEFVMAELTRFGVDVSFAYAQEQFAAMICPDTRAIYVESPSNPLLRVVDLAGVAAVARARGVLTVIDNTFATPMNQTPIELGIDVVVHSGTKYLNGHSDVNCGVMVSSKEIVGRVAEYAMNHGGTLDAHACYLLERGLKTLALRVGRQNETAGRLARFLQTHPAVAAVHYPGLPEHPGHAIAARQMRGFGGMLAFELRNPALVDSLLTSFCLVTPALSLGGVETLICVPSRTSHVKMTPEARRRAAISDSLLRVSVGIEDAEDLLEDFTQAFAAAESSSSEKRPGISDG